MKSFIKHMLSLLFTGVLGYLIYLDFLTQNPDVIKADFGISALIMAIITIASASVTAGVNKKQTREAREEARGLADVQRGDILGQQKEDQKIARGQLRLNQDRLTHENQQALEQRRLTEEDEKTATTKAKRDTLTQAAGRLRQKPKDSFLFKQSNVERFSI